MPAEIGKITLFPSSRIKERFVWRKGEELTNGLVEEEGFADILDLGNCAF
jgi:hypothetical protein